MYEVQTFKFGQIVYYVVLSIVTVTFVHNNFAIQLFNGHG